ncbi:MAG TPA: lipopolysaccharide biosynthesis protein [Solirubrobacteraceae bacterium]
MLGYLKRLVSTGLTYQAADIAAKCIALVTLRLYTRHVPPAGYGAYNSLLTLVILTSILLRVGVGEAFLRFYFTDEDQARRERLARTAAATVAWSSSVAAGIAVIFASPISKLVLGFADPLLLDCAILGLWAFTNLEMAYAQLRVDERTRAYLFASMSNVAMTVTLTVILVVFAGQQARGLLLGNFGASALVVLGLWWVLLRARRFSLRVHRGDLAAMLRFGLPTVPADASVYALQVIDRLYLFRAYSHNAAGLYSVALQLATVVFVAVRGFQYAWPPLAYSIQSDAEASRLYSLVGTYYALATGAVVCAVALLSRWIVRLLSAPVYFGAHRALPWLALGWALYGLYPVLMVIAGRSGVMTRNFPATAMGLVANVVLLLVLVPNGGLGLGIAGAGIALCGAYLVMLAAMYTLTRSLFSVGFEWRRLGLLCSILAGVAAGGELLLPAAGVMGLVLRVAWLALVPALLLATRFFTAKELTHARELWRAVRHTQIGAGGA